jgi:hypothetical protein
MYFKTSKYSIQNSISHSKIIWLQSYYIQTEALPYAKEKNVSEYGYHFLFESNRWFKFSYTKSILKFYVI